MRPLNVDGLAQEIRRVDGGHTLGAGALAEALLPFLIAGQAIAADASDEAIRSHFSKYWEHQWHDGNARMCRFSQDELVAAARALAGQVAPQAVSGEMAAVSGEMAAVSGEMAAFADELESLGFSLNTSLLDSIIEKLRSISITPPTSKGDAGIPASKTSKAETKKCTDGGNCGAGGYCVGCKARAGEAIRNAALDEAIEACMRATPDKPMVAAIGVSGHYATCANAIRSLKSATPATIKAEPTDCPHAAPHRYCETCVVHPCPINIAGINL